MFQSVDESFLLGYPKNIGFSHHTTHVTHVPNPTKEASLVRVQCVQPALIEEGERDSLF